MKKKKIVVVENDLESLEFTRNVLLNDGHHVIMASDGQEGLQKVINKKPDLVILEVILPKKNGFDVFYEMRRNLRTKDIPVMILTGVREEMGIRFSNEDIKEFMEHEPQAYIEKPLEPSLLSNAVSNILN